MIATHVSRPIRSASASGPIGWLKPSFAIVSIASGSATPSWSAQTASLMNGIRIRLETKPGKSFASAGVLPSSRASSTIAAAVSSEVDGARTTSTSAITGTGLKKCMPITRSGRPVAAASVAIGIDEVFEARIASAGSTLVGAAEDVRLHGRVLDDGLDHQVGRDELVHGLDAREHLVRVGAALLGEPAEALPHRAEAALDRAGVRIVERDPPAGAGDDLGDAAAHLAGADDEDVLEPRAGA